MILIEWEVIGQEKSTKTFKSLGVAMGYFQKLVSQWKEIVPLITNIVDEGTIFLLFQDGYLSLKLLNYEFYNS